VRSELANINFTGFLVRSPVTAFRPNSIEQLPLKRDGLNPCRTNGKSSRESEGWNMAAAIIEAEA
jgi:hypothetical protein